MNKELLKELQLQAGGSHYPDINPHLQEAFARLIVQECIKAVRKSGRQCAFTTHDMGTVECTLAKCEESIIKHFALS